jgi:ribosomal protein L1
MFDFVLATSEIIKTIQENSSTIVSKGKTPRYWRHVTNIKPLIICPRGCPTPIIMSRKPMHVPVKTFGVSSQINAEVEAITIAKPSP